MSEMTREHLEAVEAAIADSRQLRNMKPNRAGRYDGFAQHAARLSEVAAMIEAKLEDKI